MSAFSTKKYPISNLIVNFSNFFYQPQGWSGNTAGEAQAQAQVTPDNHDHQTTPTTFATPPPQTTNLTRDQIQVPRDQT